MGRDEALGFCEPDEFRSVVSDELELGEFGVLGLGAVGLELGVEGDAGVDGVCAIAALAKVSAAIVAVRIVFMMISDMDVDVA